MQEDGAFKSCVFNAVTCALLNAGIEIRDTAVGITLAKVNENVLVDPIRVEENDTVPLVNVVYLPAFQEFAFIEVINGRLKYGEFREILKYCEENALRCFEEIKQIILQASIKK